MFNNAARNK